MLDNQPRCGTSRPSLRRPLAKPQPPLHRRPCCATQHEKKLSSERLMEALRRQLAYPTLTNPLDGSLTPFSGEYTAHFRPRSLDPHQCQGGEALQTAHHVIAARYTPNPGDNSTRQSQTRFRAILGTEKGGFALGQDQGAGSPTGEGGPRMASRAGWLTKRRRKHFTHQTQSIHNM
jgi:hypothetical protein